jgi:magnesium-transporting ATPase (P-type)
MVASYITSVTISCHGISSKLQYFHPPSILLLASSVPAVHFNDDALRWLAVAPKTAFNVWQDFSTPRVVDSIKAMVPADVVVLRDGVQTSLPAASLVPGDIVLLVMGQKVPMDVKLIDISGDLILDRSVLTGEVCYDTRAYAVPPPPPFFPPMIVTPM